MNIKNNVTELIGNTPLVLINSLSSKYKAKIIGKCEFMNPTSSVKDRIGFNMIKKAIEEGKIDETSTIIEPTSGNTGIALASVCASFGLKLILTMPESMSIERRKLLKAFGAKLELTPANLGMKGAIEKAYELLKEIPNSFMPNQFENPANPEIHRLTTAKEILKDTDGEIDCFVAGVGTGGTISGVGEVLKEYNKDIKIYAVEPKKSPVLSGGKPGPHKIQGIGAGFIPKTLNINIIGEVIQIDDEEAFEMARFVAKEEGLLVGISSGANLAAACKIAQKNPGKNIITILCDTGERYLSTELFS
ncbi:cysteine synthase A [Nitrosophilus kaiyonis]|uniref:cysteine synthase A n=1 Tax=Nitrosophilus kaiyonis TaxID=2930200 RepID=UPI00248FB995|nr:cysteine synthase A [Nitrosophilus kaiyonis]